MLRIQPSMLDFEDDLSELGASVSASVSVKAPKKKKGGKAKAIFKKIGKAAAVVATGGIAAAPMLKKTKAAKKAKAIVSKAKKALTTGLTAKVGLTASVKPKAGKPKPKKPLPKIVKKVQTKLPSSCANVEEMARLVAAKLMVSLGSPLANANAILEKQDLQNQATYEHKKLMSDADFRRKVLSLLSAKAEAGNETCQKTVRVIMAK